MLSITELNKIKEIADKLDIEYFSIDSISNGIGNTLKLSYKTFVEDYPATVTVDLTDTGS
jgi:hypothetical protein